MEHRNRYDGVHPRAVQFVRYHARQLARHRAVPGMEVEDYEQDLITDLIARDPRFDPTRATYPTFADRVIRHRVSALIQAGLRMRGVGDQRLGAAAAGAPSPETQVDSGAGAVWTEERCSLSLDLERFVGQLPVRLRHCCEWLLAENRLAAAAAMGLHRSSLYEAAHDLRRLAIAAGLNLYLQTGPTPTHPVPAE
jgi:DNA-directed RNA polymerase specialized sigma24 family protein